jgi:hypothetical protein
MKKILFGAIILFTCETILAQTPEDALRYSWLQNSGTARSQALGNANGAIGGEISTMFSNPANIGFYKTGDFVISAGINSNNNATTYYGEKNTAGRSSGFLGTTGLVLGKANYNGGKVKSSAFGIAVNKVADFNNNVFYQTLADNGSSLVRTSMADMFIEDANGNRYNNLNPYGSGLAFDAYWIDTLAGGTNYFSTASNLAHASGLEVIQRIETSGGISEVAVSGAVNINDKVYWGATIGLPILEYRSKRSYVEQDASPNNTNQFNIAYFDDYLTTQGMGVNLKVGVLVKATDNLRLGLAAHTPTFYSLNDNYSVQVGFNNDVNDYEVQSARDLVYDYKLQTPLKLIGSFSYFFGNVNNVNTQKGFLSGDVEYVNYASSRFRNAANDNYDNRDYFNSLNNAIGNAYKSAVNARLGAELKFNTIMARIGGAYYGNPYNNIADAKGQMVQGSAGLGYRNKGVFIDLGYIHTFTQDVVYPYRLANQAFSPATIKNSAPRILFTLGFKI